MFLQKLLSLGKEKLDGRICLSKNELATSVITRKTKTRRKKLPLKNELPRSAGLTTEETKFNESEQSCCICFRTKRFLVSD